MILLTLSSELFVKSSRTRRRFRRVLEGNLEEVLARVAPGARLATSWDRIDIEGDDLEAAARAAARTFGVQRVRTTRPVSFGSLEELAERVAEAAGERVTGRTFAVRVKKRVGQEWRTREAESLIGSLLFDDSAGVDLDDPQVEVRLEVFEDRAHLVEETLEGPDGLPLGTQGRTLALVSGGFDSAVAAWMLMRRGSPVDFLHFKLDCSQSDHALAVTHLLHDRWGHGTDPLAHVVDFQDVKLALRNKVDARLRQVVLKQLMVDAADRLAARSGVSALVTGESVGQVSSQTLEHLAAIDVFSGRTVLRPLAGFTKQEIVDLSRRVGTEELSARAKEVCDLSDGPVAVAAGRRELARAHRGLPADLVSQALARREVIRVADWAPGAPLVPVVEGPPEGVPLVEADGQAPSGEEPVALFGSGAAHLASRLHRAGRPVWVVEEPAG